MITMFIKYRMPIRDRNYKKDPNLDLKFKNIINEMKNPLRGLNSRFEQPEEKITKLEDRITENT